MTEDETPLEPSQHATLRFMDRVKYLIKTDPDLTAAECVGCLFLLAHEVSACVFEEES